MKNNDQWYRNRFGICCDCDNFMPEDFDCVESIINDVKPLQECDKFKEVNMPEIMTVEELKVEAAKLGYYLTKKVDKYIPCTCGANSRRFRWINNKPTLTCSGCGYRFIPEEDFQHIRGVERKMKDLWNAEMIKKKEEKDHAGNNEV